MELTQLVGLNQNLYKHDKTVHCENDTGRNKIKMFQVLVVRKSYFLRISKSLN
jgi:hypothetical protein